MSEVRLDLLTHHPKEQWHALRQLLTRFELSDEQVGFGGNPAEFLALQGESGRHVFLIYADENLAGVGSLLTGDVPAELWPPQSHAIQLRGFVIDPKQQGKGIGTIASRLAIELAKSVDPTAEHLILTVNRMNPGAHKTYKKAGFSALPDPYVGGPLGPQDIMFVVLK